MPLILPENSIKNLAEVLGEIPDSDGPPAAWFMTMDPECIQGYEQWQRDYKAWRDRFSELMEVSRVSPLSDVRLARLNRDYLVGIHLDGDPPRWWRKDRAGYLVPRKRTKAERESEVNKRWVTVRHIPQAVDYMPGLPSQVWCDQAVYPVEIRRPAQAVLAFLGVTPEMASVPFEPDARWSRIKISIYHLLKERQAASKG